MNRPADGHEGRGGRGRGGRGRGGHGRHRGARRGDARTAILSLLVEEPMHGYQIMSELSDRTNGAWRPSPGSIYPLLQQLTDEGLVSCDESDGRKVFSLTQDGDAAAADALEQPPVWERFAAAEDSVDLRELVGGLAAAARQVASTGTADQVTQAAEILTETRKNLYRLLAE